VRGATLFTGNCTACHKDSNGDDYFGVGGNSGDTGGIAVIDPDDLGTPSSPAYPTYNAGTLVGVATFIKDYMGGVGNCNAQCSQDTAAYLWSLKDGVKGPGAAAISCANPNGVHYGKRVLHVLTSYEYHNSLSRLFGAPLPADYASPAKVGLDVEVARLPNHASASLNETRLNTYYDNAVEIADWAMNTPGALTFTCEDAVQCSTSFITEFAYVAYRRALTEVEQAELTTIFTDAPSLNDGLKWALRTVLMSPNFLYRSELGTKVADLLANPVVAPGTQYDFAGVPTTYQNLSIERYNRLTVSSSSTPRYSWTGKDLIALTVKGEKSSMGNWPLLTIGAGYGDNNVLQRITVNHTGYRTYYITINALPNGPIYFLNDANGAGNDYLMPPISISSISFGVLGQAEPVQDDVAKLRAADPTAFALDPYEYASALSFALTGSGPSKALLDAAVAGELVDEASREAHVDALIDSPLGRAQVARLAGKWFRTDGLLSKTRNDAQFTAAVRQSMMQEIREIFTHVFYNGDFPSMYEGDFTYLDKTLSDFYGLPGGGPAHGNFQMVNTTGALRGGVIASGAYMAYNAHMDYTSPIQRSAHFRQDVLCQSIPLPVNLEDSAEREAAAQLVKARVAAGNITTADYFDIQTNIPGSSCATCHNAIINPLFGMDDFDHVGRLRPRINGNAVQDGLLLVNGVAVPQGTKNLPISQVNNGSFLYAYDVVGTLSSAQADAAKAAGDGLMFTGAKDLGKAIVENNVPGIPACLIEKSTRFALGYTLDKAFLDPAENGYYGISSAQEAQFACIQDELEAAYAAAKSPRDVLKATVMSDAFRFRK
jgi:Protein of unknown function (DUF1592)/Protein of unknown function (DUF1588)/Protein of unknown function (DUF1595)